MGVNAAAEINETPRVERDGGQLTCQMGSYDKQSHFFYK